MTSAESDGNYPVIAVVAGEGPTAVWHIAVSYTHLTLPTILLV